MLEGVEFEKQIGDFGAVKVDVTPELKIDVEVSVKKQIDIIALVKEYAAKTNTQVDDNVIAFLEKIFKK